MPRLGLAIGWAAHRVPFQLSATGEWPLLPTAEQNVADTHETPESVQFGFGVGWIAHDLPFQFSVTVTGGVALLVPTATHAVIEEHDTADRFAGWVGFGVGWIAQPAASALAGRIPIAQTSKAKTRMPRTETPQSADKFRPLCPLERGEPYYRRGSRDPSPEDGERRMKARFRCPRTKELLWRSSGD